MIKKIMLGIMGVVLAGATIFSPVSANAKFKELEMGKIGRKVFGIRKNVDDIGCIFDYIPPMGMEQSMAFGESYRRNLNCAGMFTEQEFKSIQKKYENPRKIYKEIMKEFKTTDVPFQAREINVLMMKYGSLSKKAKQGLAIAFAATDITGDRINSAMKDWAGECIDTAYGAVYSIVNENEFCISETDIGNKKLERKIDDFYKKINTNKVKKEINISKKQKAEFKSLVKQAKKEIESGKFFKSGKSKKSSIGKITKITFKNAPSAYYQKHQADGDVVIISWNKVKNVTGYKLVIKFKVSENEYFTEVNKKIKNNKYYFDMGSDAVPGGYTISVTPYKNVGGKIVYGATKTVKK